MSLEDRTVEKILADPKFDPAEGDIFGRALVAFIQENPAEIAGNPVALKWLLKDKNVAHDLWKQVDYSNPDAVGDFLQTMKRSSWGASAAQKVISRLGLQMPDTMFDVLLASVNHGWQLRWFDGMGPERKAAMSGAFHDNGIAILDRKDWVVALETRPGIDMFISRMADAEPHGSMLLSWTNIEFLHLVSTAAGRLWVERHSDMAWYRLQSKALLAHCDKRWKNYVCYHCGKGTAFSAKGNKAPSNVIKSPTGYTLHRTKCDPDGQHRSPHEILLGGRKRYVCECSRCGEPFTTKSGRTLHEKTCWR